MVRPFAVIPRRAVDVNGRMLTEMDLDAVLARAPKLVLVDELAHTNLPGSRHPKRFMDIDELLAAGIDVFTTVNIQHIESLNDLVASFTRVRVRETVPDRVLEDAEIEVVDLPPDELIARLKAGKVYVPEEASRALGHFFSRSNLTALRELALRRAAQAIDAQMLGELRAQSLAGPYAAGERVLVAVSELPSAPELVRAAKRLADALGARWTALHVETRRTARLGAADRKRLDDTLALASSLGADTATIPAERVTDGVTRFAAEARITQIVIGKSRRSWWFQLRHGSVVDELVRGVGEVAIHVLPAGSDRIAPAPLLRGTDVTTPLDYARAAAMVALATGIGVLLERLIGQGNVDLIYLVPVMAAALLYGLRPGLAAGVLAALAYNFFFLPPVYTFTIADPRNAVTVVVLLGVAAVASQLAARVRTQGALAAGSARQNAALAGFARALAAAPDEVALAQAIAGETAALFDARAVYLTRERRRPRRSSPPYRPRTRSTPSPAPPATGRSTAASRRGADRTRCPPPTGCSCPSPPPARRARCSGWAATTAAIRSAPTSAGCSPRSSTRPGLRSPASMPSARWRASPGWRSATGCARRCSRASATTCARR